MATKTKSRSARPARTPRAGGRISGGRQTRGRSAAKPGGPMGILNSLTGSLGRGGGRGANKGGGGFAGKATSFVSGFLSGGSGKGKGKGKGRAGRRRR